VATRIAGVKELYCRHYNPEHQVLPFRDLSFQRGSGSGPSFKVRPSSSQSSTNTSRLLPLPTFNSTSNHCQPDKTQRPSRVSKYQNHQLNKSTKTNPRTRVDHLRAIGVASVFMMHHHQHHNPYGPAQPSHPPAPYGAGPPQSLPPYTTGQQPPSHAQYAEPQAHPLANDFRSPTGEGQKMPLTAEQLAEQKKNLEPWSNVDKRGWRYS
jgi:hypothetical protein